MCFLKTKKFKSLLALIIIISLVLVFFQLVNSQELEFYLLKGMNNSGQTYGLDFYDLDLIAAQGIDGTYGYILREDMDPEFKSPDEAIEWQNIYKGKHVIPLYASDGETVIGEFELISAGND